MSKRKQTQSGIDIPEPRIGRTYKLWSERSDKDFNRWLRTQSFMAPLYRIAYLISGLILLIIGIALLITGQKDGAIVFIAIGLGIFLLIIVGSKIKV